MKSSCLRFTLAVPAIALIVANAFAGDSGSTAAVAEATRVVTTANGKFRCPASALADGKLNLALCVAKSADTAGAKPAVSSDSTSTPSGDSSDKSSSSRDGEDDEAPTVVCIPTTAASGASSGLVAAIAGAATQAQQPAQKCTVPTPLRDSGNLGVIPGRCKGGGTRTVAGGYDAATGKIDVTITLKDCIDEKGATHNGTAAMQGTMIQKTGSKGVFTVNDTKTIMDAVTFPNGGKLNRTCTISRDGEYDTVANLFNGKSTRNDCVLDGQFKFKDGFVDGLIENASEVEEF